MALASQHDRTLLAAGQRRCMRLGESMCGWFFGVHVAARSPGRGVFEVCITPVVVGVGKVMSVLAVGA